MLGAVRTLLRYLTFFGVLVAMAYVVVSVEIGGATLYRRYQVHRLWPKATAWIDSVWAELAEPKKPGTRVAKKKPQQVKPTPKPVDPRARERVAILRNATRAASPEARQVPPKRKTSVDTPASPQQKKALDELLSSRVGRR
jgi:hypothetical protein